MDNMNLSHSDILCSNDEPLEAQLKSATESETESSASEQPVIEQNNTSFNTTTVRSNDASQFEDFSLPMYKNNSLDIAEESNDERSEHSYSLLTVNGLENLTNFQNDSMRINSQPEGIQLGSSNSSREDHIKRNHSLAEDSEVRIDSKPEISSFSQTVFINEKENPDFNLDSTSGWFQRKKEIPAPNSFAQKPSVSNRPPATSPDSRKSQSAEILPSNTTPNLASADSKNSIETEKVQMIATIETVAENVSVVSAYSVCQKSPGENVDVFDNISKLKKHHSAAHSRTSQDYTPLNCHDFNTAVPITVPVCAEPFRKMPRLDDQDLKTLNPWQNENYETNHIEPYDVTATSAELKENLLENQNPLKMVVLDSQKPLEMVVLENQNPLEMVVLDSQNSDDVNETVTIISNKPIINTTQVTTHAKIQDGTPDSAAHKLIKPLPTQLTLHKYIMARYGQPSKEMEQNNPTIKKTEDLFKKTLTTKTKFKSLKQLLLLGAIEPGVDVLSTVQMGIKRQASLLVDGSLVAKGKVQPSLSSWFHSVGGEKRPKLSTLSTEILYKDMPLFHWLADHKKKCHTSGTGKSNVRSKRIPHKKCSFATELGPDVEKRPTFTSTSYLLPVRQSVLTISSSKAILHDQRPLSSCTNWNPSFSSAQQTKSLLSLVSPVPCQRQLTLTGSPPSNASSNLIGWDFFTCVRLISNEELFKFSQIEWDNFLHDLESLKNWD